MALVVSASFRRRSMVQIHTTHPAVEMGTRLAEELENERRTGMRLTTAVSSCAVVSQRKLPHKHCINRSSP